MSRPAKNPQDLLRFFATREMLDASPAEVRRIRGFGFVFLFSALLANPWLLGHFKPSGEVGIGLTIFILAFDLCMLFEACFFLLSRRKITVLRSVLGTVFVSAWILALLAGAELYLATRPAAHDYAAYEEFTDQYLNPFYFFSLPSDSKVLARINNPTVSVTPAGFRGSGPEQNGNRKLAFLLGGSAAFGYGASSNQTTISGYLNEIQGDYYFVNAGVPGWNSTQEFYRVAIQLLEYKPDAIVVYDGFNDVGINYKYRQDRTLFPPGTPDSYDDLANEVETIRGKQDAPLISVNYSRLYNLTLPRVRTCLNQTLGPGKSGEKGGEVSPPIDSEIVDRDAASYLRNIDNMTQLASARGTKVVVFWQAISMSHRNATAKERQELREEGEHFQKYLQTFHRYVIEHQDDHLRFFDLSDVFDRYPEKIRLTDVFMDKVHLTDRGNHIVANEIWSRISGLR